MADPGIDRRRRERGVWGACPQVYLELVMQWRIQELTEGWCDRGGLGGLPPSMFRISNAVADPGIDGRGAREGSGGFAPQVCLELVMQWRI